MTSAWDTIRRWREDSPLERGRCGALLEGTFVDSVERDGQVIEEPVGTFTTRRCCSLPHGHLGWHRSDDE